MQELLDWRLEDVPPEQAMLVMIAAAVIGALYCFLGYRLLKFILGLTGFLLAGVAAAMIVGFLSYGNVPGMAVALFVGGICGAMALFFLYRTGIFCVGMLGTLVVSYHLLHTRPEPWILWAVAGLGLVGGLLALLVERPVMKLATAAIGAMILTHSGLAIAQDRGWLDALAEKSTMADGQLPDLPYLTYGAMAAWGLLALLGALFQFRQGRKRRIIQSG